MKKIKEYKKQIIEKIKNEDGYIVILATIVIFFFLVAILISISPPFITREKISIITRRTVQKVEYEGKVTADTYNFVNDLIQKSGLKDKNVKYSFTGNIRPNGKIQLRDEFTFNISVEEKIKLTGIGSLDINFPIKKEQTGISEVFYKKSEL